MAKKKEGRTLWQHRFNLSSDNPDHERLHERLEKLAKDDQASTWIVRTLVQGLVPEYNGSTTVVPPSPPRTTVQGSPAQVWNQQPHPVPKPGQEKAKRTDVRNVDVKEEA